MIIQMPFDLISGPDSVHAVIDAITGKIGFIEVTNKGDMEYSFHSAPQHFREKFFEKLLPLASDQIRPHFGISPKGSP